MSQWTTAAPDLQSMMQEADTALIIGDPAMTIPRDDFRVFDLATLWHEFTGLGFVFAMWMARKDILQKVASTTFAGARDEGLANLEHIASSYAPQIGLSVAEVTTYLTTNIVFNVDEQMRKGLTRYFELAHKHGMIPELKTLEFV